ncbi:MAG: leucine-rich repeat domain-containing protein, partial [Muribaculaceae bacterium]|nr:leucine-rich repeat domain-containing protein [Muribaculaceae bacterium]
MLRKIFSVFAVLMMALPSQAIIWHCDNFDTSKKLCRLKSWSGSQPTSGKLTLPTTFKHTDGKEYSVVSVAPHALDNLTEVTEIVISAQISAIGDQKASSGLPSYEHRVKNFENCPKLTKFTVASGNRTFSADDSGLLLTADGIAILRVPANIKTTNGNFTIKERTKIIGENSFMENSSIKSLYLHTGIIVYSNGGLNDTKNLAEYHFSGEGGAWEYPLLIEGNCLIEHKYCGYTAISVPPASTRQSLTLGNNITAVEKKAFRNTRNLKTVDLGKVKYIEDRIIENSAVETINIPSTVIFIQESALRNAPKLTSLTLEAADLEIPKEFARDCPMLERITAKKNIKYLGDKAFMNCTSLIQYPFSASTECDFADSIFFNTGFKKVTFSGISNKEDSYLHREVLCNAMFSNCESLHTIDFSGVTYTEDEYLCFPNPLAKKCEKLRRVIFPPFSCFWGDSDEKDHQPAFNTTNLSEIELGTFLNSANGSQFRYTPLNGKSEFTPNVYLALTRNRNLDPKNYRSMPLYN